MTLAPPQLDDAHPDYFQEIPPPPRVSRMTVQMQMFAAQCAKVARWAAEGDDDGYTVWCQQRAARMAADARQMAELAR